MVQLARENRVRLERTARAFEPHDVEFQGARLTAEHPTHELAKRILMLGDDQADDGLERNFLAFTSGLVIAGVLIPVKGRIESVIEMFVYRESYRHRRTMERFALQASAIAGLYVSCSFTSFRFEIWASWF